MSDLFQTRVDVALFLFSYSALMKIEGVETACSAWGRFFSEVKTRLNLEDWQVAALSLLWLNIPRDNQMHWVDETITYVSNLKQASVAHGSSADDHLPPQSLAKRRGL